MTTHEKQRFVALRDDRITVTALVLLLFGSASAHGQVVGSFEGCGELRMTDDVEPCLAFFAESGEYPNGLGHAGPNDWEGYQEGDRFHASGPVVLCGGICIVSQCLDGDAVIDVCTTPPPVPIPALSTWSVATLGFAFLGVGIMVMRKRTRLVRSAHVVLLTLVLAAPAQSGDVVSKVNRMLQSSHHARHVLVRFKQGTSQSARDVANVSAAAVHVKTYRFVDALTLVNVPGGDLRAALTSYLADPNVLYAEPDYVGQIGTVPNDTDFELLWGLRNTGQTVNGDDGIAGADIRAVDAWDVWTGDPGFRMAVLDTGIDYNHPDLKDNIWTKPWNSSGIRTVTVVRESAVSMTTAMV